MRSIKSSKTETTNPQISILTIFHKMIHFKKREFERIIDKDAHF